MNLSEDLSEDLKRCRFDRLVMPLVDLLAREDLCTSDKAKVAEAIRALTRQEESRAAEQRHLHGAAGASGTVGGLIGPGSAFNQAMTAAPAMDWRTA